MDKESFTIDLLKNDFIGDDGAVVGDFIYSKDIFAQDVHFKLDWMSLEQIAKKAMLVNISDAIAMNAKPLYALIGIVIPSHFSYENIKELTLAFKEMCQEWGIVLVGGDTTSGAHLTISITIISKSDNPLLRRGMQVGDLVAYTGTLGDSLKGLKALMDGKKLEPNHRFITPALRSEFITKARDFLHCGLDISDGLGKDLSRLCAINSCGVEFTCKLEKEVLCSGEEYEMLCSFSEKNLPIIKEVAKQTNTPLHVIAKVVEGEYKNPCKEHHFN